MAKVVDITDKLSFDGNPKLVIEGTELEVNADAPTMPKVMGLLDMKDINPKDVMKAFNMLIPEESRKKIEKMKLSFADLMVVVQEAVDLVVGDASGGEH